MTINYAAWLETARLRLSAHETPRLEAEVLLGAVTGKERSAILAHPEYLLTEIEIDQLDAGLSRLAEGVPLPYVLGWWEFYGRRFTINAQASTGAFDLHTGKMLRFRLRALSMLHRSGGVF